MTPVTPTAGGSDPEAVADGLCAYLDASTSPFHAVERASRMLAAEGFQRLDETASWPVAPGRHFVVRGGSLVAWSTEHARGPHGGFRVVGAHTDSPNLRIKPNPDHARAGWQLLGVEVYGGPLLNSWLDRDLGLSGRLALRDGRTVLVQVREPVLRVAQLAVHLDRAVNTEGLKLNPQQHLAPIWGLGTEPGAFGEFIAGAAGVAAGDVLGWDLMTHDVTPAARIGRGRDLIASGRLDNLATSYAGIRALILAARSETAGGRVPVLALFDHEEVGSTSERGAASVLLPTVLERITIGLGGDRQDHFRALAASVIASGDMAHATHPNYADRHEPQHQVVVGGGPVLKINNQLRYATDALGAAAFVTACEQAEVPVQRFVVRSDMPCGSTVGPMTAAGTGVTTVDFGAPMLSMHSARELTGVSDQAMYVRALAAFLAPGR